MKQRGFTLLEIMFALAILALGLSYLLVSTANTAADVERSRMRGIATTLARGKLWDVEELLRKDGFQETDQSIEGDFGDEGWATITYTAEVRKVELPSPEQVEAMAQQQAQAAAQAAEAAKAGGAIDPAQLAAAESGGGLFGMMSMFGGGMGAEDMAGAGFMGGAGYGIIQEVFKVAIRKLVLTVKWFAMGEEDQMVVVLYITDPDAMNRVIGGVTGATSGDYGEEGGDAPTTPRTPDPRNPNPNPSPK
jgi:general secretion pathway protein I